MVRSLVRPAVVGRPGMDLLHDIGIGRRRALGGHRSGGAACPSRPSGGESEPVQLRRATAALVLNYIKADKTADFESVVAKVKEALAKSEKPERKEQAAGWKIFKAAEPGPGGAVLYVWIIDPVSKGNEYSVSQILTEGFPAEAAAIYKTLADSYSGQAIINLTTTANFAAVARFRTTDSVLRRGGALASTAHRFPA